MHKISEIKQLEVPQQKKQQTGVFPVVYGPNIIKNYLQLQQVFQIHHKNILSQVNQKGALLFRGFDIKSSNEYASIMSKLGLKSFEYIGGAAVRKLVIGRQNNKRSDLVQVFTTNQAPPNEPIPFHNELLQNEYYPEYISFYCLSQAQTGGSTPIVNCHELYKAIQQKYGDFLKKLEQKRVRYIRIVGQEDNPKSPIGRGWKNIFKAKDKAQAEEKIPKAGYQFKWLNNKDNDCQLISKQLKAITISKSGRKVFCNQMIAVFKGWIDDKNNPSNCLKFGDFSDIPVDIMNNIVQIAEKYKVSIPWKVGDFIIIDNQMAKHSRQPFTGKRRVVASLFKGQNSVSNQLCYTLNSGDQLPLIGYGTWKISKDVCEDVVYKVIKNGYRLIDGAGVYGNQVQVGKGIKRVIQENIVKREDLFITSKLWNTFHHPQHVRQACLRTLKDLNIQYLDLYLMHFPVSLKYVSPETRYPSQWAFDPTAEKLKLYEDNVPLIDTYRALEKLVKEGLVKNIGVSNFKTAVLRDLINAAQIPPAVCQNQHHPYLTQKKLIRFCRQKGILMTSYSTLGASSYLELQMSQKQQVLSQNETIKDLCKKYNKSAYQIVLRWALQQGIAIIPKTVNEGRMTENKDLLGWRLSQDEMKAIDCLDRNRRYNDPGAFSHVVYNTFLPMFD